MADDRMTPEYKEFRVEGFGSAGNEYRWVEMIHVPCGKVVFGENYGEPDATDMAELLFIAQAHRCSD